MNPPVKAIAEMLSDSLVGAIKHVALRAIAMGWDRMRFKDEMERAYDEMYALHAVKIGGEAS